MVVGFIILIGLVVYLIISIAMIYFGIRYARKKGKPGWKGGLLAAIAMYLIVLWDFIPFHIAHKYYCATEGGFTVYKTLEEWKMENPGVADILTYKRSSDYEKSDNKERYILNQRFVWDITTEKNFLGVIKSDNRVIDTKTNEILAQYVDFNSGQSSLEPDKIRDFKIWIFKTSCEPDGGKISRQEFDEYKYLIKRIGR
ncbi:MAG: hypothetical protein AB2689_07385 [Candidatus Thiodiazotropha taylori]